MTQYETISISELSSIFQAYGIYYGRSGQFEESKKYFELCINISQNNHEFDTENCKKMLQHTDIQLNNKISSIIQELSIRVIGNSSLFCYLSDFLTTHSLILLSSY